MKNRMTTMINKTLCKIWPAVFVIGSLTLINSAAIAQEAAPQDSVPAGQRTDGQIEMDVVHALDASPALKQDWITAGTVQGEVTLSGTSGSDGNRQLAESIAGKVPGVTKVVNNLKVGDPQNAQNGDGQPQPQDQGQYQDPQYADNGNQQPMAPVLPPQAPQDGPRPGYQQYPPQPQYPTQPQVSQAPEPPHGPVDVAKGTLLKVRSSEPLDSKKAKVGTPVEFTVVRDVYAGGVVAVPRGATIRGEVTDVKKAGALEGHAELGLKIETLELGGKTYALDADPFEVKSPNKGGRTVGNAIGGALFGALIGGAVGGGGGAAIGAGAGAVGGTAASAATPGPRVWIPAEALMDFHLNAPVTVTPVGSREALRLAANAPPPSQRPSLYRRAYYPYGYPPPGYYYRPY
jgi:BON domain